MAGSLVHARAFRKAHHRGADGQLHHELVATGGGDRLDVMCHSSWAEVVRTCEAHGIPRDRLPDFSDCECGIDVPLAGVVEKNVGLLEELSRLPEHVVAASPWLTRILGYLRRGELVYFSD